MGLPANPIPSPVARLHIPLIATPAFGVPPLAGAAPWPARLASRSLEDCAFKQDRSFLRQFHSGGNRWTQSLQRRSARFVWSSGFSRYDVRLSLGPLTPADPATPYIQPYRFHAKRIWAVGFFQHGRAHALRSDQRGQARERLVKMIGVTEHRLK
jgi:hypothetical protein